LARGRKSRSRIWPGRTGLMFNFLFEHDLFPKTGSRPASSAGQAFSGSCSGRGCKERRAIRASPQLSTRKAFAGSAPRNASCRWRISGRRSQRASGACMSSEPNRLPSRFPVGTRYVVEGRRARRGRLDVRSRYLEFPDGRHVDLPLDWPRRDTGRRRNSARSRARK